MDESSVVSTEVFQETGELPPVAGEPDPAAVTDGVGADGAGVSGDGDSLVPDGTEADLEAEEGVSLEDLVDEETGSIPVYIINSTESEQLYNNELGGVPVGITDDATAVADYVGDGGASYQLSSYYIEYFSGVLANMSDTDYVAFSARIYTGSSYVEHNYLVYDLDVSGDSIVAGTYPSIDIYRSGSNSSYTVSRGTYALTSVPAFAYGSVSPYSDLREGVSHSETWAVLFFLGFTVVYNVCHDIFDYVMQLRRS